MSTGLAPRASLQRYTAASEQAARQIIRAYSTSFGAATGMLGKRHRAHIRNLYALVRVADELVDGVASEARLTSEQQRARLDALEVETIAAIGCGYSSNPIVHAFAHSARLARIDESLVGPFFASMRMDIEPPSAPETRETEGSSGIIYYDEATHADYVYGSAEVVGLMCLRIFVRDEALSNERAAKLEFGAQQLGAAFQNVNFLRDLADDTARLERSYLSENSTITEELKAKWISTIRQQLAAAEKAIPLLPHDARAGVDCARRLFTRLTDKLEDTPVERLLSHRVRVSNPAKAVLLARSIAAARKNVAA